MAENVLTAPAAPGTPAAAAPSASAPATPATSQPGTPAPASAPANLMSESPLEIPEKFRVAKADGTIDHEATLQKALGSVAHLEKRLGSGDVPPENESGYKLDYSVFPEGVKLDPEGEKALLKSLHAAGMTNKQVQAVINKYGEVIKAGLDIQKTQKTARINETLDGVAAELKTLWGENYGPNVQAAVRGFNHLADEADKAEMNKIGADGKVTYRMFMKFLAKVGAGITEDTQVLPGDGAAVDSTLEQLKKSDAYLQADHADHKTTVAKVTALYEKKYPKKQ